MATEKNTEKAKTVNKSTDNANTSKRDEKGHFVSGKSKAKNPINQDGKGAESKDENMVKIKIVKEKEPLPPRDFAGKLEDFKERTATQFIKSVCRRKPRKISIDDNFYYSQDVVDEIIGETIEKDDALQEVAELLEKAKNSLMKGINLEVQLFKQIEAVRRSRLIWRSVAIGLLATFLGYFGAKAIQRFCDKGQIQPAQIEQTATAQK